MLRRSRSLRFACYLSTSFGLLASAAYARPPHKDSPVPEAISVPEGNKLKLALTGSGIQRYECAAVNGSYSWKFIAPEAQLLDRRDRPAGHHGAGPYWQANDGSQVTAAKRAEAAISQETIPWLLLEATTHTGTGLFDDITFIQRIDTVGGLTPDAACAEANSGETLDIPYRALYRFYKSSAC